MKLALRPRSLVIIALSLAIAFCALQSALLGVTRNARPALAVSYGWQDSAAYSRYADALFLKNQKNPVARQRAKKLASDALRAGPLNARALRLLANISESEGRMPRADGLIAASAVVSRRELGTQLWLVRSAIARKDMAGVLHHVDLAMRSSESIRASLFPVLAQALADEKGVQAKFPAVMNENPAWLNDFIAYAIPNAKNPSGLGSAIVLAGGLPDEPRFQPLESYLLARLVDSADYDTARKLFAVMDGAKPAVLHSLAFGAADLDPRFVPLTWQVFASSDYSAAFVESGKSRTLQVTSYSPQKSLVARKAVFLAPGRHRIAIDVLQVQAGEGTASAVWQLRCFAGGSARVLGQILPISRSGHASLEAEVPAQCPAVVLELVTSGGSSQAPAQFDFGGLKRAPIGAGPTAAR